MDKERQTAPVYHIRAAKLTEFRVEMFDIVHVWSRSIVTRTDQTLEKSHTLEIRCSDLVLSVRVTLGWYLLNAENGLQSIRIMDSKAFHAKKNNDIPTWKWRRERNQPKWFLFEMWINENPSISHVIECAWNAIVSNISDAPNSINLCLAFHRSMFVSISFKFLFSPSCSQRIRFYLIKLAVQTVLLCRHRVGILCVVWDFVLKNT